MVPAHLNAHSMLSTPGLFAKKPRIGFFLEDDLLEPVPAAKRAVTEAMSRLEAAGYEVSYFSPPPGWEVFDLFNGFILADEGEGIAASLAGDVTDPSVRGLEYGLLLYSLPTPLGYKYTLCIPTVYIWFDIYCKLFMDLADLSIFFSSFLLLLFRFFTSSLSFFLPFPPRPPPPPIGISCVVYWEEGL
jgi:hypothetical protein